MSAPQSLGGLGDAVGDGEAIGQVVDTVGHDTLAAEFAHRSINDLHALELGLGGVAAPADEELVDVDDPDR